VATIASHDFASGVLPYEGWFGSSIAHNTSDGHTANGCLAVTMTDSFSGVDTTGVTFPVVAGNSYDFACWYKELTATMPTVGWNLIWQDNTNSTLRTDQVSLARATSWTSASTSVTAPAGAVTLLWTFTTTSGGAGPAYLLDDILIADTPPVPFRASYTLAFG
jgi:hypothetical protein